MNDSQLQEVANTVLRRAQRQGYVVPKDVRAELAAAGLPEDLWKDVLALIRDSLHYRQGRYYYLEPVSARLQHEQTQQQMVAAAIRQVLRQYEASREQDERRQQDRVDYVQQVKVVTEDGREMNLLSRDLSTTGIRLIAARSLLGQKIRVYLPNGGGKATGPGFVVRVLWTCAVGDDLFENGGTFLEMVENSN
jgi:hypothetical protein